MGCTFGADMQKEYLIELGYDVVAVKQPNGRVKLNQLFHPTASGAVSGPFWGTLIGMICDGPGCLDSFRGGIS